MITIKPIIQEDLVFIAQIHQKAFPESALTKLGEEAVKRYYEWQVFGPHDCLAISATIQDKIVGFCFGGVFRGALGGYLRKNRSFLFWQVLFRPWLLLNELFRERIVSALRSLRFIPALKKNSSIDSGYKPKSYGILSIAVDPQVQARGIGRALMLAAEQDAIEKDFEQMHLTVSPKNLQAINFYIGLGWVKKGVSWSGAMKKKLK